MLKKKLMSTFAIHTNVLMSDIILRYNLHGNIIRGRMIIFAFDQYASRHNEFLKHVIYNSYEIDDMKTQSVFA